MLTTRSTSTGRPFVGRVPTAVNPNGVISSDVAEVAWFVRGRTLYRRQLLVAPSVSLLGVSAAGFYANYDVSVRFQGGRLVANTLGDLTRREYRFAHPTDTFPYDVTPLAMVADDCDGDHLFSHAAYATGVFIARLDHRHDLATADAAGDQRSVTVPGFLDKRSPETPCR